MHVWQSVRALDAEHRDKVAKMMLKIESKRHIVFAVPDLLRHKFDQSRLKNAEFVSTDK